MNWKLYVLVGFLALAFAGYAASSIKENGELAAKLEQSEATLKALAEREQTVTAGLEKSNRELRKLKEERRGTIDRINRVADPTGCLDVNLDGTDFARELRDAYGSSSAP